MTVEQKESRLKLEIKKRLTIVGEKLLVLRAKHEDADANYAPGQVEIGIEIDKLVAVEDELKGLYKLVGGDE